MTIDRVAVLMTCFNRRELTLRALHGVLDGQVGHDADVHVYCVDDGSTDGTSDAIRAAFAADRVTLLQGDGQLFWNGGMRLAWWHAHRDGGFDAYVWCNDDVDLADDALATTLTTHAVLRERTGREVVVVGSTVDPDTGEHTYGGVLRPAPLLRPLAYDLVPPGRAPVQVETMNGQWVSFPHEIAEATGNLDHRYSHAMGDYDHGLKVQRHGYEVWLQPGHVGTCSRNPVAAPGAKPLAEELKDLTRFRQLPPRDWQVFARRWGGPAWPLYWASPYLRRTARLLRARL